MDFGFGGCAKFQKLKNGAIIIGIGVSSLPLLSLCVRSQLRNVRLTCLSLSFPNRCLGQYPDSTGNEYNVDNQAVLRSS